MNAPAPVVTEEQSDWRLLHRWPTECCEEVTRRGESQPCDKPAVAVRRDPTNGGIYPVCVYHTRADMVPLAVVLKSAETTP